jgi:aspartyl-tRNA(Asn)/glutamyl-tRNA(Gln) amidotransferase subunit B
MKGYTTTIGLEIHAELKTETKMFCNSKNDTNESRPNMNICPVCMGYPGTLPKINKEALRHVIRVGLALGGTIADYTEFDRKNYFYPDIPKGYQISQYEYPLVTGGSLLGTNLTRIHLEEDTARSSHDGEESLVDFNRAGIPLMELVTDPVIRSPEGAVAFAKELQLILQTLGAGDANMEKGEMRVEANISVSRTESFGTKVEVKNLNSFRAVERAIAFEVTRHISLLERGEKVAQETRGWNEGKEETFSQRTKENSHDYRYFPDPDLPKIFISEIPDFNQEALSKEVPELPSLKRERLVSMGLKSDDAEVFVRTENWILYFDEVAKVLKEKNLILLAVNYLTSDLSGLVKADDKEGFDTVNLFSRISVSDFTALIHMIGEGELSSRGGKDLLKALYEGEKNPEQIAKDQGLLQKNDEAELEDIVRAIIESNPKVVAEYKAGKLSVLQFLVGQGMKATKGSANPALLKNLFEKSI